MACRVRKRFTKTRIKKIWLKQSQRLKFLRPRVVLLIKKKKSEIVTPERIFVRVRCYFRKKINFFFNYSVPGVPRPKRLIAPLFLQRAKAKLILDEINYYLSNNFFITSSFQNISVHSPKSSNLLLLRIFATR